MSAPDMTVSWLPRPRTTPEYPQNLLRPTSKACADCSSQPYTMDDNTRRNLAGLAGFAGLHGFGRLSGIEMDSPFVRGLVLTLSVVSSGASAYHGYKRNRGSVGWAVGWGVLGALFPIITPAVALAQGFGKSRGRR